METPRIACPSRHENEDDPVILLGVVVALGVWIKYFESKAPNTEEAQRRGQHVVNFERNQLDGISIQNGDDKIELRKTNEKWRLEAPIKDQADRAAIDNLISDLESWEKKTKRSRLRKSRPMAISAWSNTTS